MPLQAKGFSDETLHYVISYKWGLIHKDAGEATLVLKNSGNHYSISLYGKTKPWADNFYQVRDTLLGKIRKEGFKPLSYSKIAHEKENTGVTTSHIPIVGKLLRDMLNAPGLAKMENIM